MRHEVITITPAKAKQMLQKNKGNFRPMNMPRVKLMARDMLSGNWRQTGESIKFGKNGQLLDGQHRLQAIVESGVSLKMLVIRGLDPDAALSMDTGKTRSVAQWLGHLGLHNASALAATSRMAMAYQGGRWAKPKKDRDFSPPEVISFAVEHHDGLQSAIKIANKAVADAKMIPVAVLGALFFEASEGLAEDNETAVWFAERMRDGLDLGPEEPVLHLREYLQKCLNPKHSTTPFVKRMQLTHAWNATAEGRPMTKRQSVLRFSGSSKTALPDYIANGNGAPVPHDEVEEEEEASED